MTGGSSAATPSIDSQRLKTRSTRARRSLSIHFASGCTGRRTISLPSLASEASMAWTVPMINWSADAALAPSNRMPIFTTDSC
jgi:hypothetical protein